MPVVYMHTNKTTGKSYIGVTTRTMEDRWNEHCRKAKSLGTHFSHAINKYGIDDWEHNILYKGMECECYIKENVLINQYDTLKSGYNSMEGGVKPPSYRAYAQNNYQFKGFYITPFGNFTTLKNASKIIGCGWQKIKKRCVTYNSRILTQNAVHQSDDLDKTMIGKTFKELGWGFGQCHQYIC